jgi:hypothetical protein
MIAEIALDEIRRVCSEAKEMEEGGLAYLYMPKLKLPKGCEPQVMDGLLCLHSREGYLTRLFLSARVSNKSLNWSSHRIFEREWHTWSWNGVNANLRPIEILLGHLRALR